MCHRVSFFCVLIAALVNSPVGGDESIEQQLKNKSQSEIESTVRLKADSKRGAVLFHKSSAGCVKCHASGSGSLALGPDLAKIGTETTLAHIVDSILNPSKSIRKGYETVAVSLNDGRILTGLLANQDDRQIVIRDVSNLLQETVIDRGDVDEIATITTSMMPGGLVSSLRGERDFYDIVRYIQEISTGGPERAQQLQPSPQELLVVDDTADLDHSLILKSMTMSDFEAGLRIFQGHCVNCHGSDGNTPTLATARAFGTQKLRFGADPY
ncbi:MAG: c-type cytochrome, partial [Planctomycetes bacterium]|nr:c-type cytochrome [Planctomycetota bacterium]